MEVHSQSAISETEDKTGRQTVLICFNGFQNSDTHDATSMMELFERNFKADYQDCEIVPVHLFYPAEKKTHSKHHFEKQARAAIEDAIRKNQNIVLLGYSFSCSLAAKMAKVYRKDIQSLVLVAPVYDTLVNGMIPHYIQYAWKFHRLMKRYGKKAANTIGRKTTKGLPGLLIAIFHTVLADRHYIRHIKCRTLVIRGQEDMLCTEHALGKVQDRLKGEHQILQYPKMTHGIMKSIRENGPVYDDILHFAFHTPKLLGKSGVEFRKPVAKPSVKYDEDGNRIPTFNEIFTELDPDADTQDAIDRDAI